MSKHERFTTAVNDSTGDLIKTKASGQDKYAKGWEAIFGKKGDAHSHNNSGVRYTGMMLPEPIAVFEEEHIAVPFVEEPLPSGIIGEEI